MKNQQVNAEQNIAISPTETGNVTLKTSRPAWDRSGLKGAVERGIALGRTHDKIDLILLRDMLNEIEKGEHAVNSHASLVAAIRDEIDAITIWQSAAGFEWRVASDLREGLALSLSKLQAALAETEK